MFIISAYLYSIIIGLGLWVWMRDTAQSAEHHFYTSLALLYLSHLIVVLGLKEYLPKKHRNVLITILLGLMMPLHVLRITYMGPETAQVFDTFLLAFTIVGLSGFGRPLEKLLTR